MRYRIIVSAFAFFAIVAMGLSMSVQGQSGDISVKTIKGEDRVIYKKKTVIDFEDATVEGELVKPEQSSYTVRGRTKFNSLIQYRPNFVPEMWNTARNL
jgi:hypothetical protein